MKKWRLYWIIVLVCLIVLTGCTETNLEENKKGEEYGDIFEQMFAGKEFSYVDSSTIRVKVSEEYGETYYIGKIIFGNFSGEGNEYLAVIGRPYEELAHAEGFYNGYTAVFNKETGKMVSSVKHFISDEGEIKVYQGINKDYIFFAGSTTFQGWTEWNAGLYALKGQEWEQTWPVDPQFLKDRGIQGGRDRVIVYKREVDKNNQIGTIPPYKMVFEHELLWNKDKETFLNNNP
ncbi:MAG: hypothetical protein ACOYVD_16950 [Bacillota bacterium]